MAPPQPWEKGNARPPGDAVRPRSARHEDHAAHLHEQGSGDRRLRRRRRRVWLQLIGDPSARARADRRSSPNAKPYGEPALARRRAARRGARAPRDRPRRREGTSGAGSRLDRAQVPRLSRLAARRRSDDRAQPVALRVVPCRTRSSPRARSCSTRSSGASPLYYNTLSGASGDRRHRLPDRGRLQAHQVFQRHGDRRRRCACRRSAITCRERLRSSGGSSPTIEIAPGRSCFGGANDRINPKNGVVVDAPRNTLDFLVGVTQALSADSHRSIESHVFARSWLLLRSVQDARYAADHRRCSPGSPATTSIFPGRDATLRLSYRYLHDSFGSTSNAFDATWFQPLPHGWSVAPSLRYYTQTAADFYYNPPFPDGFVAGQNLHRRHATLGVRRVHAGDHHREDASPRAGARN